MIFDINNMNKENDMSEINVNIKYITHNTQNSHSYTDNHLYFLSLVYPDRNVIILSVKNISMTVEN